MGRLVDLLVKERGDWLATSEGEIRGVIHGTLPNKSNSKKIATFHGRAHVIKSEEALDFVERFRMLAKSCAGQYPRLSGSLFLRVHVYQEDLRRDLDIELLADALEKNGLVKNDRHFWRKEATRRIDRDRPRVEFRIGTYEDDGKPLLLTIEGKPHFLRREKR